MPFTPRNQLQIVRHPDGYRIELIGT